MLVAMSAASFSYSDGTMGMGSAVAMEREGVGGGKSVLGGAGAQGTCFISYIQQSRVARVG